MNNGAVVVSALAFCLIMVGGLPLLLAVLAAGCIWFVWSMFRKEPEPESNGWCRDLQRELEEERNRQI
ncbi:hypothetical protein [Neisseria weaveri]|uniref:hypothetical protein n=1 Tax=Neisseria weaveri TaxID=28091 RepID=UPI000D3111A4|nr:hypothetical protein [Neisseria weaveri]